MNLKALYDKVVKAEDARNKIAQEIVRLNDEDKYQEALGKQESLEATNAMSSSDCSCRGTNAAKASASSAGSAAKGSEAGSTTCMGSPRTSPRTSIMRPAM